MGLLAKLFGSSDKDEDKLVPWLKTADNVYRKAFVTRRGDGLVAYFTSQCISRIMERIRIGEPISSGIERYMSIGWTKVGECEEGDIYEKDVTYEHIRMAHGVVVPVGDDYTERWLVIFNNKKNKIADVRRLENG